MTESETPEIVQVLAEVAAATIAKEGATSELVRALSELEDFHTAAWQFEPYAVHQAAQQISIQANGQLLQWAPQIAGATNQHFVRCLEVTGAVA